MAFTNAELAALNFGYLAGYNLMRWASPSLLLKQLEVDPAVLMDACNTAYKEVSSKLSTRYNLTNELQKQPIYSATAVATLSGTGVNAIIPSSNGPGYYAAPSVSIANAVGDTTGNGASATAIISPSTVTSIQVIERGVRYSAAPTVVISGGGGSGATAEAVLNPYGGVQSVTITNPGSGYTTNPTVMISPPTFPGRCAFAAASITFGTVTGFTITAPGTAYTKPPIITLSGGIGTDQRNDLLVKILAICAVRNTLGSLIGAGEMLLKHYKWADEVLLDVRNGQETLSLFGVETSVLSESRLVSQRFKTIG